MYLGGGTREEGKEGELKKWAETEREGRRDRERAIQVTLDDEVFEQEVEKEEKEKEKEKEEEEKEEEEEEEELEKEQEEEQEEEEEEEKEFKKNLKIPELIFYY